jgi:hypothetical protein
MKGNEIINHCKEIMGQFEWDRDGNCPLSDFIDEVTRKGHENLYGEVSNVEQLQDLLMDTRDVSFAFGYLIGQGLDLDRDTKMKDLEPLKKILREKRLLLYYPRDQKPAQSLQTYAK